MDFPYKFSCGFSNKRDHFESCRCVVQPLTLHLQSDSGKRQFKLLDLRFQQCERSDRDTIMLMSNQEQLYFRFVDHVDFRVCQSTLRSLVPDGEFSDYWRKEEPLEVLSTQTCELFMVDHKKKLSRMMVRKLRSSRPSTGTEIEFIRLINNRCVMKPDSVYVDGGFVKLLYKPFNGILLKRHMKKKKLPQEDQLRQFVSKMMFFLSDLESRKLRLTSFKEDFVLLQSQKYSLPQVLDLSSVQSEDQLNGGPNRHIWSLGVLLYKIVVMKSPDLSDLARIKRWLSNETAPFNEAQTIYNKSFFEMVIEMLSDNGNRTSLEKLLKHRWFLEKFDNTPKTNRLATIKSVTYHDSELTSEREEDFSDEEVVKPKEVKKTTMVIAPNRQDNADCIEANHEYSQGEMTLELRMSQLQSFRQVPFHFLFQFEGGEKSCR